MDDAPLWKKTLKTAGLMLGAWGLFMGALTLVVVFAVGRVIPRDADATPNLVPASKIDGPRSPEPSSPKSSPKRPALPTGVSRAT